MAASSSSTKKYFLNFNLKYTPNLAGKEYELPNRVVVYPSFDYSASHSSGPHIAYCEGVSKDEKDGSFTFKDQRLDIQAPYPYIPNHIKLNFEAYAELKNECGEWCVNQAGIAQLKLRKFLLRTPVGHAIELPLTVPLSRKKEKTVKGTLILTVLDTDLPFKVKPPRDKYENVDKDLVIRRYIDENQEFYREHPPVDSFFDTVRVFCFNTKSGLIPGSLYNLFPIPKSREEYYLHALDVIMVRKYPAKQRKYLALETLDQKLDVIMAMLHLYVNYCKYITDLVDNNVASKTHDPTKCELFDSFDDMRSRNCGDCEDGTCEIHKEVAEIKHNIEDFVSDTMRDVRTILRKFIFVSALCVVDNRTISNTAHSTSNRPQAHECAMAIPNYIFFKALERSGTSEELLAKYSDDEKNEGSDAPIFILEGTGNLIARPKIKPKNVHKVHKKLSNANPEMMDIIEDIAINQFFFNPNSKGFFYDILVTLVTPEFYYSHQYPVLEFLVCNEIGQRGVKFSEFVDIEEHPDLQLLPAPKFLPDVLALSMRVRNNEYPPSTLDPPPSSTIFDQKKPNYKKYQQLMNGTTTEDDYYTALNKYGYLYCFQLRFDDITEKIINDIIEVAQKVGLKIYSSIELIRNCEQEGKIIGGLHISFFKKK